MSSYEYRRNAATGDESHRIRFRHDGKNRAKTFVSCERAMSWKALLDTLGGDRALSLLEDVKPATTRTVADQVDRHIRYLTDVTEGTRKRYQHIADERLRPAFGSTLVADLTRDHVAAWINRLAALPDDERPAPKTIRNWQGLLSAAMASAVRDGDAPSNPVRGVRPPKRTLDTDEMVFLTGAEVDTLLELIPERHRALVTLLVLTGVRWGEATALTPADLDHNDQSARIRQAWKFTGSGSMTLGPPKSARSRRTVAVPEEVFAALEPHLAGKKAGDLIFTAARGGPLRSGTFHNTVWQRAAEELERRTGKKPRVHDLRHTFASWAIARNVPLPIIQRQMGHESITTTVDTYGHLARSDFDPLLSMGSQITKRPVLPSTESAAVPSLLPARRG